MERYGTGLINFLDLHHLSENEQINIITDFYKKAKLEELIEFVGNKVCKFYSSDDSAEPKFSWIEGIDADRIRYIREHIGGEIPQEYNFLPNFEILVPRDWFDSYKISLESMNDKSGQLLCGSIYCKKDELYNIQCDIETGDFIFPEGLNQNDLIEFFTEFKRQMELAGQFCFLFFKKDN